MRSPALRRLLIASVVVLTLGAALVASAFGGDARAQVNVTSDTAPANTSRPKTDKAGVQHLHFEYGPLKIRPGQNVIDTNEYRIPQPEVDGWIVGFKPNLRLANGKVPPVDVIHLHHGVWANAHPPRCHRAAVPRALHRRRRGEDRAATSPRATATAYRSTDGWYLNYMIHNLTPKPFTVSSPTTSTSCPQTSRARERHEGRAPDLARRAERQRVPGVRRAQGQRHRREVHLSRRRPDRAARRTPTRCRPTACS